MGVVLALALLASRYTHLMNALTSTIFEETSLRPCLNPYYFRGVQSELLP